MRSLQTELRDVERAIRYFRAEEKVASHPETYEELLEKKRKLEKEMK